jgi:uncharacterized protein YkwD
MGMMYRCVGAQPGMAAEILETRCLMSAVYPTVAEQYMLELVNRARANPVATATADGIGLNEGLAAGTISADAKQPLAFNPNLTTAATNHTAWMLQTGSFQHNEGASDPGAQMQAAGYAFTGWWTWGQNIAWSGSTPNVPEVNATTAQLEKNLFIDSNEPGRGHRVNLLNPQFQEIGVGITSGRFESYNAVMATQDFAASGSGAFLTGVAYADANRNGSYDPGEGLGGISVTATRVGDGAIFSTTTWAAGGYSLALGSGTYAVNASGTGLGTVAFGNVVIGSQNIEADFTPGSATQGSGSSSSSSSSSGDPTPTSPPSPITTPIPIITRVTDGWVTGTVFSDKNGNGLHDRGEGVFDGWRVYADLNGDGKWERGEPFAITNARGIYRLKLSPGSYTIREVPKGFWTVSAPTLGAMDLTVLSGDMLSGQDFGNVFTRPVKRKR